MLQIQGDHAGPALPADVRHGNTAGQLVAGIVANFFDRDRRHPAAARDGAVFDLVHKIINGLIRRKREPQINIQVCVIAGCLDFSLFDFAGCAGSFNRRRIRKRFESQLERPG